MTTTPRRLADLVLARIRADLGADPFDTTVCGDEVPARKPDPAPYLQAMAALGVDPAAVRRHRGLARRRHRRSGGGRRRARGAGGTGAGARAGSHPAGRLAGVDVAELADVLARRDLADAPPSGA